MKAERAPTLAARHPIRPPPPSPGRSAQGLPPPRGAVPPRQESGGRGAGREEGGWWHPRRARSADPLLVPPLQTAASKFQALQRVYAVLADPAKRQAYDRTGCLADAEDLAGESFDGLYSFFRSMYKKVEEADLDAYEDAFRGSAEEEGELLELHARFKGDMDAVFDWLPCSDPARDAHRFAGAVRAAVKEGEVAASKAFDAWAAKKVDGVPAPAHPLNEQSDSGYLRLASPT